LLRSIRSSAALVAAAALLVPFPARAQSALTLDGTAARVAYDGGSGQSSFALTPGLQILRPWRALSGTATWAQFPAGVWSAQGALSASAYTRPVLGVRAEVAGFAGGTLHQDDSRSGQYEGELRLHRFGRSAGGWIGASAGRAWAGDRWRFVRAAELGGWVQLGRATLDLALSPSAIGDSLRFLDAESTLQLVTGRLDLVAHAGARHWTRPAGASSDAWGAVSAAWWLSEHLALTAGGGEYPADYAQGLAGGRYVTAGIRVATGRIGRTHELGTDRRLLPLPAGNLAAVSSFEARSGNGRVTLIVRAAPARIVEIMGDFTDWQPVSLHRADRDRWVVSLPISPGVHRFNVRVDGGRWGVPASVTTVTDEFNGSVGIVVIE
jgi:hypothetical protein